jgi:hypothetical protein
MRARLFGLRNALLLRNAPATEGEFNVLRTARVLTFAFGAAPGVAIRVAFRVVSRLKLVGARLPTESPGVLRVAADGLVALRGAAAG